MPNLGDKTTGRSLGKSTGSIYTFIKCPDCGKERWANTSQMKSYLCKSCSSRQLSKINLVEKGKNTRFEKGYAGLKGSENPYWKGGKSKDANGYIRIRVWDYEYPGKVSVVLEHRHIIEQHLGRKLLENETVHHKNGVRDDNRIENLELKASNHGAGQTVSDLIEWAITILKRYSPDMLR